MIGRQLSSENDQVSIATGLCLATGLWQILLACIQLGKFSWILSDVVMSAYTTGAAIHVFTSQLKALLGVSIPAAAAQKPPASYFNLYYVIFSVPFGVS